MPTQQVSKPLAYVYRLVPDRRFNATASTILVGKRIAEDLVLSGEAPEAEVWALTPGHNQSRPVFSVWRDDANHRLCRRDAFICPECGWGGANIDVEEPGKRLRCSNCSAVFAPFSEDQKDMG